MTEDGDRSAAVTPPHSGLAAEGAAPEVAEQDDRALELREEGRSFAAIARLLGMTGGLEAHAAFNRALRRQPAQEQTSLRDHEMARLDALGERVRQRDDIDEAELARRMRSIDRLRKSLFTA